MLGHPRYRPGLLTVAPLLQQRRSCCSKWLSPRAAAGATGALTTQQRPSSQQESKSAIVVGAGVGGLVVAGRLAKEGVKVTLLEQNEQVSSGSAVGTKSGIRCEEQRKKSSQ